MDKTAILGIWKLAKDIMIFWEVIIKGKSR